MFVLALRRPSRTISDSNSWIPGSSIGETARLMASTTSDLTSQATTCAPLRAIWHARGRPIFPAPTTATRTRHPPDETNREWIAALARDPLSVRTQAFCALYQSTVLSHGPLRAQRLACGSWHPEREQRCA